MAVIARAVVGIAKVYLCPFQLGMRSRARGLVPPLFPGGFQWIPAGPRALRET